MWRMNNIDAFLVLVDSYGASAGVAEATVSSRLFNDGKRIASIRRGSDVGVRRLRVALEWLSDHWPEGAAWPCDIPRPFNHIQSPASSSAGEAGASSPNSDVPAVCQGRAEVARLAHNQEVAGSNPAPATSLHDELCHPSTAMQVNGNPSPTSGAMDLVEVGTGQISAVLPQESHKATSFSSSGTSSQSDGSVGACHPAGSGSAPASISGDM